MEGADGLLGVFVDGAFLLIEEQGCQSSPGKMEIFCDDIANFGADVHLREELEVGDPKGAVGFEGGDDPRPDGLETLGGRGVGGNVGLERLAELLIPFAEGEDEGFGEESLFGGEVIADGGEADACGRGDIAGGGAGVALVEQAAFSGQ